MVMQFPAWIIVVELRHLPDAFEAVRLVRGCTATLPLGRPIKDRIAGDLYGVRSIPRAKS